MLGPLSIMKFVSGNLCIEIGRCRVALVRFRSRRAVGLFCSCPPLGARWRWVVVAGPTGPSGCCGPPRGGAPSEGGDGAPGMEPAGAVSPAEGGSVGGFCRT